MSYGPQWPSDMAPPWLVVRRTMPDGSERDDFVALKRLGEDQFVAIWGESWPKIERVRKGDVWRSKWVER